MTPDHINGAFELLGGFFALISVRSVLIDRQVKGVSWLHVGFFSAWGLWNVFFYPYYGLWWSFVGGVWLVSVNTFYVALLIYYGDKKHVRRNERD